MEGEFLIRSDCCESWRNKTVLCVESQTHLTIRRYGESEGDDVCFSPRQSLKVLWALFRAVMRLFPWRA